MCGIFGTIFVPGGHNIDNILGVVDLDSSLLKERGSTAAGIGKFGLLKLQNRGQDSSGIIVFDSEGGYFENLQEGTVKVAHTQERLERMVGDIVIGQNRYTTIDEPKPENVQPFVVKYPYNIALSHNGNIVNTGQLRETLDSLIEELDLGDKLITRSQTDSELILHLIAANAAKDMDLEEAIPHVLKDVIGTYSLLIGTNEKLIGVRDPYSNRPIYYGRLAGSHFFASERRVIDDLRYLLKLKRYNPTLLDTTFEIEKGKMYVVKRNDMGPSIKDTGISVISGEKRCSIEDAYLMRVDEYGLSKFRKEIGRRLFERVSERFPERYYENYVVCGIPDSGRKSAEGFAHASEILQSDVIMRDHTYEKRTFIHHYQKGRDMGNIAKIFPITEDLDGKNIFLIDDSIIRSTTLSNLIKIIRLSEAKVKSLNIGIATPPYQTPCFMGIHTPEKDDLVANGLSEDQIEMFFMTRFYGVDYDKKVLKDKVLDTNNVGEIVRQSILDSQNYLTDFERGKIEKSKFSLTYLGKDQFKESFGEMKDRKCYACFETGDSGYPDRLKPFLRGKV